jgi:hypothetical protein
MWRICRDRMAESSSLLMLELILTESEKALAHPRTCCRL